MEKQDSKLEQEGKMTKPLVFNYHKYEELRDAYKALLEDNNKLAADNRRLREGLEAKDYTVAYICDGRACEADCSVNECELTRDITHAKNFKKLGPGCYAEKTTVPLIRVELKVCGTCRYYARDYEDNDICCANRKSRYYRDCVAAIDHCDHWSARE